MNKNIIKTLNELIKIPSVTSDFEQLKRIILYIQEYFSDYENAHISIHRFDKYPSIVIWNTTWKDADIILNGHVDVVPPSEENQFIPTETDQKIIARGSWDMKAWIAIMLELMKDIFKSKYIDKKILLIITTDEEVGWENWAKKIVELWYTAKGVLVPDSWDNETMVIAQKWIYDLEVEISGKSGHASRPWLWDNAIEKTYNLYKSLQELIQDDIALKQEWNWESSVNLTRINAGTATNVIPDTCHAFFDIRVTEEFSDTVQLENDIKQLVKSYDSKLVSIFKWDLVYTDPSHSFIASYIDSYEKVTGNKIQIKKEHWASDGRYFASKWMPLLLQRPTCANIHSKNEWVDIDSIENIYRVYKHFIFENTF